MRDLNILVVVSSLFRSTENYSDPRSKKASQIHQASEDKNLFKGNLRMISEH